MEPDDERQARAALRAREAKTEAHAFTVVGCLLIGALLIGLTLVRPITEAFVRHVASLFGG